MGPARIAELRNETIDMFYHGFDNYMNIAFPEDELAPVSCAPLTRDVHDPQNLELNDVLGNYSLTLIDSLSTLAILASAPDDQGNTAKRALRDFQEGVVALVAEYGDGSNGPTGLGARARGFDLDSKVQVFETVIRGVGGLLSAHLFAIGELPIKGYSPAFDDSAVVNEDGEERKALFVQPIVWPGGFMYSGQLLRLAFDLAERLLPAFYSATGMPYPRVNLRHGIPFYKKSPLNQPPNPEHKAHTYHSETTETCSAGAGSLVLEFTVLSRLSGDPRFEQLAKRAFWAVWAKRSEIGLIGAGIDAEAGHWIGPFAGIGAGSDSFFEYALKTHILTSGLTLPNLTAPHEAKHASWLDPNTLYRELTDEENAPDSFLLAWKEAHEAIKRHIYSRNHHPHYVNVHLQTGSPQIFWIDSLGAYYPGLLALAGELEEAVESNLLYTALWTRYAALPERWSVRDRQVEMHWWPLRPEFIESNYHLYRATKDPWYLHVGEMVLKDIEERCWTPCGWSGLQDVHTGHLSDRMQSFFLGETAKYLYLLFDPDHPLNSLDGPYVFSTEGHPLIIPRKRPNPTQESPVKTRDKSLEPPYLVLNEEFCPAPPEVLPFGMSPTAGRADIFHASNLVGLHNSPNLRNPTLLAKVQNGLDPGNTLQPIVANHSIYPWTLPTGIIPSNAMSGIIPSKAAFSIQFPSNINAGNHGFNLLPTSGGIIRIPGQGILVKSMSGIKFELVEDDTYIPKMWRISTVGRVALGRDENVFIAAETMGPVVDPTFTRIRDQVEMDLVIQLENFTQPIEEPPTDLSNLLESHSDLASKFSLEYAATLFESKSPESLSHYSRMLTSLLSQVTSVLRDPLETLLPLPQLGSGYSSIRLVATSPTGPGAAAVPSVPDAPKPDPKNLSSAKLSWTTIFFADEACDGKLPDDVVRNHHIIVIKRGGCTFSQKLEAVPAFFPSKRGLKLVIIVDFDDEDRGPVRPMLDVLQVTPGGMRRIHEVPMVIVGGGEKTWMALKRARSVGIRRRYWVESMEGMRIGNLVVV